MESQITDIQIVYKGGAFGNPDSFGRWIYGRRPDGKTVACKNEETEAGGMRIWSYWQSPDCNENEIDICETEFSAEEWRLIENKPQFLQPFVSSRILRERAKSEHDT